MPHSLSAEQRAIIRCIGDGKSCISDSVPGAGKTTTGTNLALEYPHLKVLCLTFSSSLKAEGRGKAAHIRNIEIQSYNSWILKNYGKGGTSNEEVYEILRDNSPMKRTPTAFDVIILDETQDMMIMHYQMIRKFVKDCRISPKYLVIGDQYQGVFEFLGADRRYLTLADRLFPGDYETLHLTRSFRLTDPIGAFMNDAVLGEQRISTDNPSDQVVDYIVSDPRDIRLFQHINRRIDARLKRGAKLDDFFILFAGLGPGTPAPLLDAYLTRRGKLIAFLDSDSDNVGEGELKGKIAMTTFHKSKGRERKYVFVFNVDTSYFKYYKPGADPFVCPPELYVALTRATTKLWVIQGYKGDGSVRQCPFFKHGLVELKDTPYCNVQCNHVDISSVTKIDGPIPSLPKVKFNVTDFIKYLTEPCEKALFPMINQLFAVIHSPDGHMAEPSLTIQSRFGTSELISDLIGIAVPSYIGHTRGIRGDIHRMLDHPPTDLATHVDKIHDPPDHISDHLRFANISKSSEKGIRSNLRQVTEYGEMVTDDNLKCYVLNSERIHLGDNAEFEYPIKYIYYHKEYGAIDMRGRIDSLGAGSMYEFKCTKGLQFSHKLQVVVYSWMVRQHDPDTRYKNYLFNFSTGELLEMTYSEVLVDRVMDYVFAEKFRTAEVLEDNGFIKSCCDLTEACTYARKHPRSHCSEHPRSHSSEHPRSSRDISYMIPDSESGSDDD